MKSARKHVHGHILISHFESVQQTRSSSVGYSKSRYTLIRLFQIEVLEL